MCFFFKWNCFSFSFHRISVSLSTGFYLVVLLKPLSIYSLLVEFSWNIIDLADVLVGSMMYFIYILALASRHFWNGVERFYRVFLLSLSLSIFLVCIEQVATDDDLRGAFAPPQTAGPVRARRPRRAPEAPLPQALSAQHQKVSVFRFPKGRFFFSFLSQLYQICSFYLVSLNSSLLILFLFFLVWLNRSLHYYLLFIKLCLVVLL